MRGGRALDVAELPEQQPQLRDRRSVPGSEAVGAGPGALGPGPPGGQKQRCWAGEGLEALEEEVWGGVGSLLPSPQEYLWGPTGGQALPVLGGEGQQGRRPGPRASVTRHSALSQELPGHRDTGTEAPPSRSWPPNAGLTPEQVTQ